MRGGQHSRELASRSVRPSGGRRFGSLILVLEVIAYLGLGPSRPVSYSHRIGWVARKSRASPLFLKWLSGLGFDFSPLLGFCPRGHCPPGRADEDEWLNIAQVLLGPPSAEGIPCLAVSLSARWLVVNTVSGIDLP